jgi:hypothetical protein
MNALPLQYTQERMASALGACIAALAGCGVRVSG